MAPANIELAHSSLDSKADSVEGVVDATQPVGGDEAAPVGVFLSYY